MRSTVLVAAVTLGHELGLTVTAEGVETLDDWRFMQSLGCDLVQGGFISPALDARQFARLLIDGHHHDLNQSSHHQAESVSMPLVYRTAGLIS